jgi:hypothetical protein
MTAVMTAAAVSAMVTPSAAVAVMATPTAAAAAVVALIAIAVATAIVITIALAALALDLFVARQPRHHHHHPRRRLRRRHRRHHPPRRRFSPVTLVAIALVAVAIALFVARHPRHQRHPSRHRPRPLRRPPPSFPSPFPCPPLPSSSLPSSSAACSRRSSSPTVVVVWSPHRRYLASHRPPLSIPSLVDCCSPSVAIALVAVARPPPLSPSLDEAVRHIASYRGGFASHRHCGRVVGCVTEQCNHRIISYDISRC